ncbi:MAG: GNAT family N-acetyltransferase [Firmicutes bacterium]|nr:GNAT family N-acetyltransferase [Bacillota bacterium]
MTDFVVGALELRPARPEDAAKVARLCLALDADDWLPEVFADWAAEQDGTLFVAMLGGELVGIAGYSWVKPGEVYLKGMRVSPAHQRLGIGKALTRHATEQAFLAGARVARLTTRRDNQPAQTLLASAGYRRVGSWDILPGWNWAREAVVAPQASEAADEPVTGGVSSMVQQPVAPDLAMRQAGPEDLPWPWLQRLNGESAPGGLIAQPGEEWEVQSLDEGDLCRYLAQGQVWVAGPGGFPPNESALALVARDIDCWTLRQFAGAPAAARRLLAGLDRRIREEAIPQVDVTLPGSQFSLLVEAGLAGFTAAHWPGYIYQVP